MGNSTGTFKVENQKSSLFDWDHYVFRRGAVFSFSHNDESLLKEFGGPPALWVHIKANGDPLEECYVQYNQQACSKSKWNLKYSTGKDYNTVFHLESPCDCEIGEYEIVIMAKEKILDSANFLMLFNPWNPDDDAYMPDEDDRNEYILNTKTLLYVGDSNSIQSLPWDLDQFNKSAIELLIHLCGRMTKSQRSCTSKFARELTALMNSNDDNGVLVSGYNVEYKDGKPPNYWFGSKAIFKKYMKHKKPVKYGQCYTFAGILCSLLRLAGYASRTVSCCDCMRNTNDTLDREIYLDSNNELIAGISPDNTWDFHCWVECYMKCVGSDKYNGWHVCDSTPMVKSFDNRFVCGPAPVSAVKAGDLDVGYDCRYVFSEVSGNVLYKKVVGGQVELCAIDGYKIGKNISTKAVGSYNRSDITDTYKHKEGSLRDSLARKKAENSVSGRRNLMRIANIHTVNHKDHILLGENLDLSIELLYESYTPVDILIKCHILQYPNIRSSELACTRERVFATGNNALHFRVDKETILSHIKSDFSTALVEIILSDGDIFSAQEFRIRIKTPSFDIIIPDDLVVNESSKITVSMKNPFHTDLYLVNVRLEMEFVDKKHKMTIPQILPGESIDAEFNVVPTKKGVFEIRAIIYGYNIPAFKEVKSANVV